MKKLVLVSTVIASLAGMSAFGQGYVNFATGKSVAYDGFTTPGVSALGTTVNAALMWAPVGTPTPAVTALLASTPTTGNSTTVEPYTVQTAWSAILSDPNFTLAYNWNGGSPVLPVSLSTSTGAFTSAGAFHFSNSTGSLEAAVGTSYQMFFISWNASYATPALAQANNSAVGWSPVFSYLAYALTSTATALPAQHFGTFVPAPEPTTLALAGLGGLSLLLFRRRK